VGLRKFSRQASDIVTHFEIRDKFLRGLRRPTYRRIIEKSRCQVLLLATFPSDDITGWS